MPRIAGVDIPNEKRVEISLQYIYGIGPHFAQQILKEAHISPDVRSKNLTEDEVSRIAGIIDRNYTVEGALRRQISQNIARLKDIGAIAGCDIAADCHAGVSGHEPTLERARGPRKTVAGKKGVKEMHRG